MDIGKQILIIYNNHIVREPEVTHHQNKEGITPANISGLVNILQEDFCKVFLIHVEN